MYILVSAGYQHRDVCAHVQLNIHSCIPVQYPFCFLDLVMVLIQNIPHRIMCLNAWFSLVTLFGEVAECLGGRIRLEEAHHGSRV